MRAIICLSVLLIGIAASPLDSSEIPAAEPEYLDKLLAEKRYEEFSYLMDIQHPELSYSKDEGRTPKSRYQAMLHKELKEGDILKSSKTNEQGRQGIDFDTYPGNKWPARGVPYTISNEYSPSEKKTVQDGIDEWNRKISCIKFRPRSSERDYVHFFPGDGCYSNMGKTGKQQPLSLDRNGCLMVSTVVHEMEHAIGISHEHNRGDRDDYIKMLWDNIPDDWHDQFFKNGDEFGLQGHYDYYSIMHYEYIAPDSDKPAFKVLEDGIDTSKIGTGDTFTDEDIEKIEELYCN